MQNAVQTYFVFLLPVLARNGISVAFLFFRTCQEIEGVLWVKFTLYGCVVAQRVSGDLCNRTDGSLDIATYVVW